MPPETQYPEKTLIYKICEFFLEIRRKQTGLGTKLHVRLQEMGNLLEHAISTNDEDRIKELGQRLSFLDEERFGEHMDKRVIEILDISILEDFLKEFKSNETLYFRCSSENLKDYISELKRRTQDAISASGHGGSARLEQLDNGRIKILFGNEVMRVNKTKKHTFDLSIHMVRLMYGYPASLNGDDILINNYERGNHITYEDLLDPLRRIEGEEYSQSSISDRSIKDIVRSLNGRALKKLGHPLFKADGEGLSWAL